MSTIIKAVFAFALGIAAVAGVQHAWLSAIKQRINAPGALRAGLPEMKPAFPQSKIGPLALPKMPPIDTRFGEKAAISSMASQIDRQIRAANSAVPQPRSFPGVPRF